MSCFSNPFHIPKNNFKFFYSKTFNMRSSVLLPLVLFASAGLAQYDTLAARYTALLDDELDYTLQAREADAWALAEAEYYDSDSLSTFYARALLDDSEDLYSSLYARTNKPIVGDLVLGHHKDAAKSSNSQGDAAAMKALKWNGRASAHNMAGEDNKAKWKGALGQHYTNQALSHYGDRDRAQSTVNTLHSGGVRRLQRREEDEYFY